MKRLVYLMSLSLVLCTSLSAMCNKSGIRRSKDGRQIPQTQNIQNDQHEKINAMIADLHKALENAENNPIRSTGFGDIYEGLDIINSKLQKIADGKDMGGVSYVGHHNNDCFSSVEMNGNGFTIFKKDMRGREVQINSNGDNVLHIYTNDKKHTIPLEDQKQTKVTQGSQTISQPQDFFADCVLVEDFKNFTTAATPDSTDQILLLKQQLKAKDQELAKRDEQILSLQQQMNIVMSYITKNGIQPQSLQQLDSHNDHPEAQDPE